jgi:hypothetical protein
MKACGAQAHNMECRYERFWQGYLRGGTCNNYHSHIATGRDVCPCLHEISVALRPPPPGLEVLEYRYCHNRPIGDSELRHAWRGKRTCRGLTGTAAALAPARTTADLRRNHDEAETKVLGLRWKLALQNLRGEHFL